MKKTKLITVAAALLIGYAGAKAQNPLWVSPSSNKNYVGINNSSNPGSRLEITTVAGDPYYPSSIAPGGSSGLKFTNMKAGTSTTITNPGPGVCAVDSNGHVIYVPNGTIGGICGSAAAMTNNREVPMAGYNLNFTMPANSASEVLIGLPTCSTSVARLGVANDHFTDAGFFLNTLNSSSQTTGVGTSVTNNSGNAIGFNSVVATTNNYAIGVNSIATAGSSGRATGVNSNATSVCTNNIAINGAAGNASVLSISANLDLQNSSSPINIGHQTDINGGTNASATNYGAQVLINNPGSANYGYYASVTGTTSGIANYGIYATAFGGTTNWAGYFAGDVQITGNLWNNLTLIFSDKRFKNNITKLESVTDKIKKLSGYTYNFNTDEFKEKNFSKDQQIGLIAQEVKEVFPQLVKEDDKGFYAVNYQGMVPVLLEAIKEQQGQLDKQTETIQQQQKQIDELKALVQAQAGLNNSSDATANRQAVELSSQTAVVLNQNIPNPFAEQSLISYNIPQNAGAVQILFYSQEGQLLKTVDITSKGKGTLTVFANDLTNGIYNYTLVIDGKVIDTKKMIKQQ